MISPGMKWLIALALVIAFASGEQLGYRGAMHGMRSQSPQETSTP